MNTLFRLALYITIVLMMFNLGWGLLRSMDGTVFADVGDHGADIEDGSSIGIIRQFTGLKSSDQALWGIILSFGVLASLAFSWMVHSLVPVALYIFSVGFWGSYHATITSINIGGVIPAGFMLLVTGVMAFLFLGAIIGLTTGNG
jgi:hypothetical protein